MKSQKGVTLTSLIIYVIVMTIAVSIITVLSTYFNKNIINISNNANGYKQYTKFNSYFLQDTNKTNNEITECQENYIVFANGNQYTFQNNSIYFNKIKICTNIQECIFNETTENGRDILTVNIITDNDKIFATDYIIKNW